MDSKRFSLEGKVALITGGSRGIGKASALAFAEAGADVVVSSRKQADLDLVADEIKAKNRKGLAIAAHVAKLEDQKKLVDQVVKKFGRIDILFNNAGTNPYPGTLLEAEEWAWDTTMNVNLKGQFFLAQRVAKVMKEKGGGKIINVSSIYGSRGSNEEEHPAVAYNPSKFAVEGLTKTLAAKLARYKIYVNCIAPGFFKTDMMAHLFKPEMKPILDLTVGAIPLKMYGEEDDVKGLAVFLASRASNYVTGGIFPVDGGLSAS